MKKTFTTAFVILSMIKMQAQDIHFARVQDMSRWYNPSLQTSRDITGYANYRNVNYQGIVAFRSAALVADVPLMKKAERTSGTKGYPTLSAGVAVDKSNGQILRNTMGFIGLSYSLPLNEKGSTYLAGGFQESVLQSRVNMANATLPDQFDKFGLIPNRSSNDPMAFSSISYLSLNTGLSVFHNGDKSSWYVGGSLRHANRPVTNNGEAVEYRLPMTVGAQFSYGHAVSDEGKLTVYGVLNWKAKAYEHLAALLYMHELKEYNKAVGVGVGYRYKDAIIPNIELRIAKTTFGFHYDYNISGMRASGFSRESFEFGVKQKL